MIVEKSKDYFDAYSENCDGIYAAGNSIDAVKADAEKAIKLIKQTLPEKQWPNEIKGDYEIEWKFDVASFLEYYSSFMSLAGMEKMTGINQKQLSNYLNHRAVPRKKQTERIREGRHKFAHELLSISLYVFPSDQLCVSAEISFYRLDVISFACVVLAVFIFAEVLKQIFLALFFGYSNQHFSVSFMTVFQITLISIKGCGLFVFAFLD